MLSGCRVDISNIDILSSGSACNGFVAARPLFLARRRAAFLRRRRAPDAESASLSVAGELGPLELFHMLRCVDFAFFSASASLITVTADELRRTCRASLSMLWLGVYSRSPTLYCADIWDRASAFSVQYSCASSCKLVVPRQSVTKRRREAGVHWSVPGHRSGDPSAHLTALRPAMSVLRDSGEGWGLRRGVGEKKVLRRWCAGRCCLRSCQWRPQR